MRTLRFHSACIRGLAAFLLVLAFAAPAPLRADDACAPPGDGPAPDVFSRLAAAGGADDHGGADWVVVLDEAINRMKPSGVTYVDRYVVYKVLTPAGCRDRSVLHWGYDPQSSHVEVREVNVVRDGKRIAVDVSAVRDLPAPQRAIYWKDRIKTLQLPRLRPGDGIEVRLFRKGFTYALLGGAAAGAAQADTAAADTAAAPGDDRYIPPMPGEYFDIVLFAGEAPILEKRYVLNLPGDKRLHAEVYNGPLYSSATYDEERTQYAWWGFDLAPAAHGPAQPAASDFATKVVMATAESWEAKSRWFFDVNLNQFEPNEAIREKVREILAEAGLEKASEEARAKALLHWVAQNIRYSGQTMGEGEGFTLHPGSMIFEQRSGVCKDIAGMLITMMRAAGMDSYAAMTMAGSRIEEVPADQFNHCVCALRKEDGSFVMYDPTWVPYNNEIWSLLEAEQHYLVGTPDGETLSRIRYSPPEDSPLRVVHLAKLERDGTLEGSFRLDGSGALDGRLRRMVTGSERANIEGAAAALLAPIGNRVEAVRVRHREADDFSGDMWVEIDYRIPGFALPVDGGLEFESPLMNLVTGNGNLFRASAVRWPEERGTDVFLYYTQLLDGSERIRLPRGWKAVDTPAPDAVDETYAAFGGGSSMDGRDLVIESRAEIRRRQIPPDGYPGFKRAVDEAARWSETTFHVRKGGAR